MHTHIYIYIYREVHTYTYIQACKHTYTYIYINIYIYIYIYTYIYLQIYFLAQDLYSWSTGCPASCEAGHLTLGVESIYFQLSKKIKKFVLKVYWLPYILQSRPPYPKIHPLYIQTYTYIYIYMHTHIYTYIHQYNIHNT